jgi:hypothetical protein
MIKLEQADRKVRTSMKKMDLEQGLGQHIASKIEYQEIFHHHFLGQPQVVKFLSKKGNVSKKEIVIQISDKQDSVTQRVFM